MPIFPSRLCCALIVGLAAIDFVWINLTAVSVSPRQLTAPVLDLAIMAGLTIALCRTRCSNSLAQSLCMRVGHLVQGLFFLQISWIVLRLFNHLSMTTAFPFADPILVQWDSWLPVRWDDYFRLVQGCPLLRTILGASYTSLSFCSFLTFLILVAMGDARRTAYFLETFLVVAVICTAIGMFLPAKAAVQHYFGDVPAINQFDRVPGVYHLAHLERLRSGEPILLNLDNLPGLVTFPSFHTAAGVVLVATFRRTALFPIALVYSVVMIASTPVFGGHYFIDLLAGSGIALFVQYAFASRFRYADLFRPARQNSNDEIASPVPMPIR